MLTNHMSSLNLDGTWYLNIGHTLHALDFQKHTTKVVFETDSLLSPIVKLNKVKTKGEETIIIAVTLDNRVYKIGKNEV